jgi:hypothetical protein
VRRLLGDAEAWQRLSSAGRAEMATRSLSASVAAFVEALA